MKLLFVHDTKLKEDTTGRYYTGGSFNKEIWDRYLLLSKDFSVIARKERTIYDDKVAEKRFNYFDKKKINFIEVPDINSSLKTKLSYRKRKRLVNIMSKAIMQSDFVIIRLPSTNGNIAVNLVKKFNKPYLIEIVGCSWDSLWNHSFKGKLIAPVSFLKQKNSIKDSKYAIYVTESFLQKRYPTKGSNVNCSNVLLDDFDNTVLKKRLQKIKSISKKRKLLIGTTGAVNVRYKGQDSVIKALGILKKKGLTNFEYQLVGGGDESYLKSIAEDNGVIDQVKFLGALPHKSVINWLDTLDIYLQPSKTEGLPRSLIEAMSRGLLSLGTNVGGIPELLDEKYLISNSKKNVREIANKLSSIKIEDYIEQAQRNFNTSKKYNKEIIESRRQAFLRKFINQL